MTVSEIIEEMKRRDKSFPSYDLRMMIEWIENKDKEAARKRYAENKAFKYEKENN